MDQYAGSDDLELVNWEERLQALIQIWPWINYAVVWKITPDKRYLFKLFNSLLHYYYQAKNIPVSKLEGGIEPRRKLLNLDLVYTAPSIDRIWFTKKSGGALDFGFARTSFRFREVLRMSCGAS
jgi:hypothetical protein